MDNEKMRAEFESAWLQRYPDHEEIAFKRSYLEPDSYVATRLKDAWWAWQASRAEIVVELPERRNVPDRDCWARTNSLGYNTCNQEARLAIEAAGLKVTP